jgi:predicted nucleic acid-binding protein
LTEVLQGFRHDKDYNAACKVFEDVTIFEMLGVKMAIKSAENFRALRKRGITVRKTADVIIATFCINQKLPLLFSDKDFKPFVKHLGLVEA